MAKFGLKLETIELLHVLYMYNLLLVLYHHFSVGFPLKYSPLLYKFERPQYTMN